MVRHTFARGAHRTWVLTAALCTSLLMPSAALAQKDTAQPKPPTESAAARHLVVVGQKPIQIPVPVGFVEPSLKVPGFAVIGEQFTPPTNRYLAMFVTPEDMAAAGASKEPAMRRYFLVQTLRAMEVQVAMSITTAVVQGRLVYFYTYSKNETKDDMAWVRRKATEWVQALGTR